MTKVTFTPTTPYCSELPVFNLNTTLVQADTYTSMHMLTVTGDIAMKTCSTRHTDEAKARNPKDAVDEDVIANDRKNDGRSAHDGSRKHNAHGLLPNNAMSLKYTNYMRHSMQDRPGNTGACRRTRATRRWRRRGHEQSPRPDQPPAAPWYCTADVMRCSI